MTTISRRTMLVGLPALAVVGAVPTRAAWPDRNMLIVHGLGPGGGVDVTARILADRFSSRFGHAMTVEARPGAATMLAAGQVAKAPPDGYTLAVFPSTYAAAVALRRTLPFRPVDDFAIIGQISEFPYIIATYREHTAASFQDLIRAARSAPQPLTYATPGQGSAQHLLMAMLAKSANVELQHVPFRGGPQALTEVLAKRIDLIVDAPVILTEHISTGGIRALAVTTRQRSSWLPEVPSLAESGFADFDVRGWMGLVAPAGLTGEIAVRLNAELAGVLADADVKQRLRAVGTEASASSGEDFKTRLIADIDRWTMVIAQAGIERI
jgi:tripartite-type tricarboxylate transporter receptor subunit TctC